MITIDEFILRIDNALAENGVAAEEIAAYKADLPRVELVAFDWARARLRGDRS